MAATMPNAPEVVIVGTLHALPKREATTAIAEHLAEGAGLVLLETDLQEAVDLRYRDANFVEPQSLRDFLEASEIQRLSALIGANEKELQHIRPWVLATALLGVRLSRLGWSADHGLEPALRAAARKKGLAVQTLESLSFQLQLMASIPDQVAARRLALMLRKDDEQLAAEARELLSTWSGENWADLRAKVRDLRAAEDPDWVQRVAAARNALLAERLHGASQSAYGRIVAVVGVLHLDETGSSSLPGELRKRGWTVSGFRCAGMP